MRSTSNQNSNPSGHLPDTPHHFYRELRRPRFPGSASGPDRANRFDVFSERVQVRAQAERQSCFQNSDLRGLRRCAFFARIIEERPAFEKPSGAEPGRSRRTSLKQPTDIIAYRSAVESVSIEPGVRHAQVRKKSQRKRWQINGVAIRVELKWVIP